MKDLYENYRRICEENKKREAEAESILLDALEKHFKVYVDDRTVGWHECKESPIGVCVYDTDNDFNRDECLVCHEPADRG